MLFRRTKPTVVCVFLSACIDYQPIGVGPPESEADPVDSAVDTSGDSAGEPVEVCDGLDNDGDSSVDEGWPDVDADGIADCVDDSCDLDVIQAGPVSSGASGCSLDIVPPEDPWSVEHGWEYWAADTAEQVRVYDLDGDGVSEVLVVSSHTPDETVRGMDVLSGLDGSLVWSTDEIGLGSALAIADVDGDGSVDIVGYSLDGELVALDNRGTLKWTSPDCALTRPSAMWAYAMDVQATDVDGDGEVELVANHCVAAGRDGRRLTALADAPDSGLLAREIAVVDLDEEAGSDIVSNWRRYRTDGALVWDASPALPSTRMAAPLVVQADSDSAGEVVWIGQTDLLLVESDGTELWHTTPEGDDDEVLSLGCSGDVNGDGRMELVFSDRLFTRAWEMDGTELWSIPFTDSSTGVSSCTTFDFDLDGKKEVVMWDMFHLWILDGTTGGIRYEDPTWFSTTTTEWPILADVDGDGSVDILAWSPSGPGWGYPTLRVYHSAKREWPPGTSMWPESNWSGVSRNPDGSIPRTSDRPWTSTGVWRGQPEGRASGVDVRPVVGDSCVASCESGPVTVSIGVENLGPGEVPAGLPVAVYLAGAQRSLLHVGLVASWLDNGTVEPAFLLSLTPEQAQAGIVIVAGDDGTGTGAPWDCDAANNTLTWASSECG